MFHEFFHVCFDLPISTHSTADFNQILPYFVNNFVILGPIMTPACLGCLQTLKADHISCPICTLPICSSNCDMLDQHLSQECKFLAQARLPPLQIDLERPNSMYNCIGLMRLLLQMRKADEENDIYGVNLLMDHYEERY